MLEIEGGKQVPITDLLLTEASADLLFQNPEALHGFDALLHDDAMQLRKSLWDVANEKLAIYRENRRIVLERLAERTRRLSGVVPLDASGSGILHGVHVPAIRTSRPTMRSSRGSCRSTASSRFRCTTSIRPMRGDAIRAPGSISCGCRSASAKASARSAAPICAKRSPRSRAPRASSPAWRSLSRDEAREADLRVCRFEPRHRAMLIERPPSISAAALAARDIELVYGGGCVGLMGVLADAMLARGGRVTGVIPHTLIEREVGHRGADGAAASSIRCTNAKRRWRQLSDGFIALPGGFGTLEEIVRDSDVGAARTARTSVRTAERRRVLRCAARVSRPLRCTKRSCAMRHIARCCWSTMIAARLLDRFATYRAPVVDKWLQRSAQT